MSLSLLPISAARCRRRRRAASTGKISTSSLLSVVATCVTSFAIGTTSTNVIAHAFVTPQSTTAWRKFYEIDSTPTALYKKPNRRRKNVVGEGGVAPVEEGDVAPNLRRKVRAPRPSMGHVVPHAAREAAKGGSKNPTLRPQGKARDFGMNNPSNLKILGGTARGRRLDSPEVYLRPMMGKVREAVFSTFTSFGLYDEGVNTRHLDIFSGSGSVGLESLSRGASHATFVDFSQDCCNTVERNAKWCRFEEEGQIRTVCSDYLQALRDPTSMGIPPGTTYEIVTLTPPYEEVVYADLIDGVANSPLVTDDTVVMIEYPVELGCLPHVISRKDGGALVGVRNRRYGRTVIAMYVVNPTGRMEVADSRPEDFIEF